MSASNTALMSPEEAYDVLVAQVHAPVYFNKLAQVYGIVPQTPQHARDLIQMAGQLRNVHENENTKSASAQGDLVSQAKADLDQLLQQHGYATPAPYDPAVKQACMEMAGNDIVREAALVFQNYLSNQK